MNASYEKLRQYAELSAAKAAPVVVAAGMALAALAPAQGATVYWFGSDNSIGGDGVWNLSNSNKPFKNQLNTGNDFKAWNQGDSAIFSGTGGQVTVDAAIQLGQLQLTGAGYSFLIGASGSLQFTGTAPSIVIAPGASNTFSAPISLASGVTAPFVISSGDAANTVGGTFVFGRSDLFADSMVVELVGGSVMDLGSYTDTVAGFTLTRGSIRNGTLHSIPASGSTSPAFTLVEGTVDATLVGERFLKSGSGTVSFGSSAVLSGAQTLTVNDGVLNLGPNTQTVPTLNMNGGTLSGSLSGGYFIVRSGTINANLMGDGGYLTKSGTGLVTLNGVNSYTGATTVLGGTLELNGSITRNGGISVYANSVFGGRGSTVSTVLLDGGTISPGLATVSVLRTGTQTWAQDATYSWNMQNPLGRAGDDWDLLSVTGTLRLAGDSKLVIWGLNTTGLTAQPSYSWTLVSTSEGVGLSGYTIAIDDSRVTYGTQGALSLGVVGNNLDLIFTPVPEPKTYAMVLGAITLGLVGYRRWRRAAQAA